MKRTRLLSLALLIVIIFSLAVGCTSDSRPSTGNVDISTGKIGLDNLAFIGSPDSSEAVKWVLVDYGAALKSVPDDLFSNMHGVEPIDFEFINKRSVFVVNSI
ncbi:hypothetical protein ACFLWR_06220, partial [Chloroflexota bacterium]